MSENVRKTSVLHTFLMSFFNFKLHFLLALLSLYLFSTYKWIGYGMEISMSTFGASRLELREAFHYSLLERMVIAKNENRHNDCVFFQKC